MRNQTTKITKEDFEAYARIQRSGSIDMSNITLVSKLSGLSKGKVRNIRDRYREVSRRFKSLLNGLKLHYTQLHRHLSSLFERNIQYFSIFFKYFAISLVSSYLSDPENLGLQISLLSPLFCLYIANHASPFQIIAQGASWCVGKNR